MHSLLLAVTTAAPGPVDSSTKTIVYILAAIFAGGVFDLGWRIWRRSKYGTKDDALEIAKEARQQASASSELWVKYKVELEDAKGQISQYLQELVSVNRELGKSIEKVDSLERELRHARSESGDLRSKLEEAKKQRDELLHRIANLMDRIETLESQENARQEAMQQSGSNG
jgi:chromosome segregation ATPase